MDRRRQLRDSWLAVQAVSGINHYSHPNASTQEEPSRKKKPVKPWEAKAGDQIERRKDGVWLWKKADGTQTPIATIENIVAEFLKSYDEGGRTWKREGARAWARMYEGASTADADFLLRTIQRIDSDEMGKHAASRSLPVVDSVETEEAEDIFYDAATENDESASSSIAIVPTAHATESSTTPPKIKLVLKSRAFSPVDSVQASETHESYELVEPSGDFPSPEMVPTADETFVMIKYLPREELFKLIDRITKEVNHAKVGTKRKHDNDGISEIVGEDRERSTKRPKFDGVGHSTTIATPLFRLARSVSKVLGWFV